MAHHWSDNVHTTAFTPRDYQVELLAAAREKNIIVCVGHNSSKEFIALKLIHELGFELRQNNRKITIYITSDTNGESAYNLIYHLTDLKPINLNIFNDDDINWDKVFECNQVVIMKPDKCLNALVCGYLDLESVNLIVVEDCHKQSGKIELEEIFSNYYVNCVEKPKILGLAGPLHSAGCPPGRLGAELEYLEKSLFCKAETASDIVTVLRYCPKPIEIILQCAPPGRNDLTNFLKELVLTRKAYLMDHRFDPSEIYSDEFMDELKAIPDPKTEPIKFLNSYLEALEELGPWCADRAALSLLVQIEKCKVKTPYERHFLLLCLVSTTFVQVRAYCDYFFQKLPNEKERVEKYSSPKILRVLETLRLFRPDPNFNKTICNTINGNNEENSNVKTNKNRNMTIMKEIEEADFNSLGMSVEQVKENVENEIDLIEAGKIKDSLRNITQRTLEKVPHTQNSPNKRENRHFRTKRRFGPSNRFNKNNYLNNNNDPDALCGILFCNSKFTAKVLFSLFNEMSRNDSELNYLTVQYTVDKVADPITEAKEAENEHRKQEEVLKRFRMHECNLLIGTSVLEEGIDLPKCNLVVRWDPPKTYRSYVQCKGRARAPNAYHVIIVAPKLKMDNDDEREHLSDKSHKFICFTGKTVSYNDKETENEINDGDDIDDDDNDDDDNDNDENSEHLNMIKEHPNEIRVDTQNIKVEQIDDNVEENIVENVEKSSDVTKLNGIIHNHNNDTADINNSDKFRRKINNKKCIRAENKSLFQCPVNICDEQTSSNESVDFQSMNDATNEMVERLAEYMEIEKMLIRNCNNSEPLETEIINADKYTSSVLPYKPLANETEGTSVNLASAVALVNKYCAKLPSDTFTKLTPIWRFAKTFRYNVPMFQCTLRLPINSPIKYDIIGLPMPTKILARRISALIACKMLHLSGELDNNLQPIGKEGFRPTEPDWENFELEESDEIIVNDNSEPRPGTTKRRQYYYKRVASAFSNCRPTVGSTAYLYHISMILKCPIPEEQNTRGRKIYPPEDSPQGFGILTLNKIPKISSFPIFTRSGEVEVSLVLTANNITLDESQLFRINTFINYTFTNVLRLQKYLMLFDPEATENCFFIVPTIKIGQNVSVDWNFLKTINDNAEILPQSISDEVRKEQEFDPNKFKDAVVMPWYRNQDQPQYFYVAEICNHLSPESSFPGENYSTFQEYYYRKYGIQIQNTKQPLLDVDHTSARLNFLTPRYVNRKGVALPTSSEETKRAKRENLEQKQILVPELCTIHPFPASLWRAAVCLPCILYRTNALLLADEIRKQVSKDLGLGTMDINDNKFEWPSLDFGWSLAEVLRKSRESKLTVLPNSNINSTTNNIDKVSKENSISSKTEKNDSEKTANDILEEADRKLKNECMMEIGTWSNEMADNISMTDDEMNDEDWGGILPPNINMCSRNKTQIRYGSPTSWDVKSNSTLIENYYSDSDVSYQSDDDEDLDSVGSDDDKNGKLRIEFKSDNVAEAIETEEEIIKRQKQQAIINDINANEKQYQSTKNIGSGFNSFENQMIDNDCNSESNIKWHEGQFEESIKKLQEKIITSGMLIRYNEKPEILNKKEINKIIAAPITIDLLTDLIPYATETELRNVLPDISENGITKDVKITLEDIYKLNQLYLAKHPDETYVIDGSSDVFDKFNDREKIVPGENKFKTVIIEFLEQLIIPNKGSSIQEQNDKLQHLLENMNKPISNSDSNSITFSFDYQPNLVGHPGPSPSIILQGLTMSNANDGINLERLETIGDSFLKYAITTYLYCTYENVHEGKLSHLRSKQVSNLNLYRLGRKKILGESMISTKFEPHDNWLPPCYYVPRELEKALIEARIPACHWNLADLPNLKELSSEKICELVKKRAQDLGVLDVTEGNTSIINGEHETYNFDNFPCFIPYNLITQHSIPDKSVADCVEALIGAYLIECGPRGALLFMAWLGIRVLPLIEVPVSSHLDRIPGSTEIYEKDNQQYRIIYGTWTSPKSPLLHYAPNPYESLEILLDGFSTFEEAINYKFKDRSYLLQAMTHASYSPNRLTDCYQRLEFLGDAILDYLITRHLYEDPRQHSPGALTDLRSALVNNTIFASLAVRHGFHKYFRHLSPGLNEVIDRFVRIQHENGHSISEEYYLISEEECDEAEDVEVPKALGDVFESVAGAIFLDSNMSLDTVWNVYSNMMRPEIEQFSNSVPKSPIRELLELEPETAKFGKPEKLADGRRVRVIVEVFGKGTFRGIGRNYRIAKCTAAKCALRQLKKQGLINRK